LLNPEYARLSKYVLFAFFHDQYPCRYPLVDSFRLRNRNELHGFLFNLAEPFTHVGAVATYRAGAFDAALGAVNGWDVVTDNNTGKTILGKAAYTADAWGSRPPSWSAPNRPATAGTTASPTM
jgi:hypothetical protein